MNLNRTTVTEFILLGFPLSRSMEIVLSIIITMIYTLSIIINFSIIMIIRRDKHLHKPMYFFIGVFSFLELWYPTATVPRLLLSLIFHIKTISFAGCMVQYYFHFALGATENFLLVAMAYDRYLAICMPLHYPITMNQIFCLELAAGSWFLGLSVLILLCVQLSSQVFCGPNQVDHYYCDFAPVVKLACSNTKIVETTFFVTSCFVILASFLLIIVSYIYILSTVLKLRSLRSMHKTFYTCTSHLTVVLIFYGTNIFMFVRPSALNAVHINKMISIFPSVVTPLLNPIIYSLRNQEVKIALRKAMHCQRLSRQNNAMIPQNH